MPNTSVEMMTALTYEQLCPDIYRFSITVFSSLTGSGLRMFPLVLLKNLLYGFKFLNSYNRLVRSLNNSIFDFAVIVDFFCSR